MEVKEGGGPYIHIPTGNIQVYVTGRRGGGGVRYKEGLCQTLHPPVVAFEFLEP